MHADELQKARAVDLAQNQIGYLMEPRPVPDQLHIERIDGGFFLSGWRNGENTRCVAHNVTRLVAVVRAWADPGEPKEASAES
jgi:hypothetical protein